EPEEIAMRLAGGRTGSGVADLVTIVRALPGAGGKRGYLGHALLQLDRVRGQVEEHPVHPGVPPRVGIVAEGCTAARTHRDGRPLQTGGAVLAVAGARRGYATAGGERRGREDHARTRV